MPSLGDSQPIMGLHFLSKTFPEAHGDALPHAPAAPPSFEPFPPPGGPEPASPLVLPAVAIREPDFPWQWSARVALLVFFSDEWNTPAAMPVPTAADQLPAALNGLPELSAVTTTQGKVNLLQLSPDWLLAQLPSNEILDQLSHQRQELGPNAQVLGEAAWVLATRLPKPGDTITCSLVSLAGMPELMAGGDPVALLEFFRWQFQSGTGLGYHIQPGYADGLSQKGFSRTEVAGLRALEGQVFTDLAGFRTAIGAVLSDPGHRTQVEDDSAFVLPDWESYIPGGQVNTALVPDAAPLFSNQALGGLQVLGIGSPDQFLHGLPAQVTNQGPFRGGGARPGPSVLPVLDAAELVTDGAGVPDISQAVAWQIGNTLGRNNEEYSRALINWRWKRPDSPSQASAAPQVVQDFLGGLARLEGLPLAALVPDPAMLPEQSARLLLADPDWLEALLDGAYAVGRMTEQDLRSDALFRPYPAVPRSLSGVLLRSPAVALMSSPLVQAFTDPPGEALPAYLQTQPQDGVLLALFEGQAGSLSVREQSGYHYRFSPGQAQGQALAYEVRLRDPAGGKMLQPAASIPLSFKTSPSSLLPDWNALDQGVGDGLQLQVTPGILGLELLFDPGQMIVIANDASDQPSTTLYPETGPVLVADELADISQLIAQQPVPDPSRPSYPVFGHAPLIPQPVPPIEPITPSQPQPPLSPPPSPPVVVPVNPGRPQDPPAVDPPPLVHPPAVPPPPPAPEPGFLTQLLDAILRHPRLLLLLLLLLVFIAAGGLHLVNAIWGRIGTRPLITHFQGLQSMEEMRFVEQQYQEIIPVTDEAGKLQFLVQAPAYIYGSMDMTQLEFREKGDAIMVTLPPVFISDPYVELDSVREFDARNNAIRLFFGGGGNEYDKAYHNIGAAIGRAKDGIRQSALKNGIEDEVRQQARAYFINLGRTFGEQIGFEEPEPGLLERLRDETIRQNAKPDSSGRQDPVPNRNRRIL